MFSLCERVYKQLPTYQKISPVALVSQNHIQLCHSTIRELKNLSSLLRQLSAKWHLHGVNNVKEQGGNQTELDQSDGTAK